MSGGVISVGINLQEKSWIIKALAIFLGIFLIAVAFMPTQADAIEIKRPAKKKPPKGTSKRKIIYLTYDDGPSKNTKPLLNVLKKHKVQATFFVIGQNKKYLPVMTNEYKQGHTVAIHSWTHNYKKIYSSKKAYFADRLKIQREIKKRTGITSKYVRFPGGGSNTVSRKYNRGIMSALAKSLKNNGYRYYDWNVSSGDSSGKVLSATAIYKNVIRDIKVVSKSGRSSMVLMHDTGANKNVAAATEKIIKWGKKNGYHFVRLDSKTPQVHHRIAN